MSRGTTSAPDLAGVFPGDSEMATRMRALDWSATRAGAVASWPESLATAVRIVLSSRYPMFIWWGREGLVYLYNDAYIPVLGTRHPDALGRSGAEVWPEIWSTLGPLAESVFQEGRASWSEELPLLIERSGYREETFFTFSYSPILEGDGSVGGLFCACTEDTKRVVGERRLRTLRALAGELTRSRDVAEACAKAARELAGNPHDLPFVLLYLVDGEDAPARLVAAAGVDVARVAAHEISLHDASDPCGFGRVARTGASRPISALEALFRGPVPCGSWDAPPTQALVVPLPRAGHGEPAGFAVFGLSPRHRLDDDYRGFCELLAGHVAAGIGTGRAYEEERRRAEALAELDHAKTAFFSNVSHEFRTPLTLMLGPLEEVLAGRDEPLGSRTADRLAVAHRNSLRLLKLVNTLLDFSRIEAGRIDAVYEETDIGAYTEELASVFRSAVERAGLSLEVSRGPVRDPVYLDRQMWEKVILNLLSNALKFTLSGGIVVSVAQRGPEVHVAVRDTGSGIPPEELAHVFERFHRVRGTPGRTHEGTGIGLALVRDFVQLHGGTVSVESRVGTGSVFRVSVPVGRAHLPPERVHAAPAPASRGPGVAAPFVAEALGWLPDADAPRVGDPELRTLPVSTAGARILLADDNRDMRDYVARLLSAHWHVDAVGDGGAALAAARAHPPDLVLTDVMMPVLDGFELIQALRSDPATRTIPIVLLSARAGEEARVEGMAIGADDYLVKPFSARELLARVNTHLELARLRRQYEAELAEKSTELRRTLDTAATGLTRWSRELRNVSANRAYAALVGLPLDEIVGRPILDVMGADAFAVVRPYVERVLQGERVEFEAQVPYRASGERYLHVVYAPDEDPDGRVVGWVASVTDITPRRHAEEALRSSEEFARRLADVAPSILYLYDLVEARNLWGNREMFATLGYRADDMAQMGSRVLRALIHPDDWAAYEQHRMRLWTLADGDTARLEYRMRHADGTWRWLESRDMVFRRDEAGRVRQILGAALDVTARVQAERHLRDSEARFRATFDTAAVGIAHVALDGRWLRVNDRLCQITGYSRAELLVRTFQDITHPDDVEGDVALAREVAAGTRADYTLEKRYVRRDGSVVWVSLTVALLTGVLDEPDVFVAVVEDVTDRKAAEDALREAAQRKDEFLAMLAHELRNPLAPVRNAAEVLRAIGSGDARIRAARDIIERQVSHMTRLIDDLLDVSRITRGKIALQKERLALAEVVDAAVDAARPEIERHGHTLSVKLAEDVFVDGDRARLVQVVTNLLANAVKFTPRGGHITVRSGVGSGRVVLCVRDTGVGVPKDAHARIFELFRQEDGSLERAQGGLGIGLTLVKRLVEMHGGTVAVESEGPGKGAEFQVTLPTVAGDGAPQHAGVPREEPAAAEGPLRILVVEDSEDAAESFRILLELSGHVVAVARDGLEGLRRIAEFDPDVAFVDLGLPGVDGYGVAGHVRGRGERRPVLVALSGYGREEDRRRAREAGFDEHMTKPVDYERVERFLVGLRGAVLSPQRSDALH